MDIEVSLERRAAVHRALGEPHRLAIVDALGLSDRSPSELAALTGIGSNLVAFHLGVLEAAGVVERTPSEGDARRRYVRLHRDVLSALAPRMRLEATEVLFVCSRNSARSQLAAALWERRTGRTAGSAGTEPADAVHPLAVAVAAAHGIDLGACRPRGYDEVDGVPDLVVAVCDRAREASPPFAAPVLHWSVPDPAGGVLADFEVAFRALEERVDRLAATVTRAA